MPASFLRDGGPCQAEWNGVNIGELTVDGIGIKIDDSSFDIKTAAMGNLPVDKIFNGRGMTEIEIPLTRFSISQLLAVFPGSTLTGGYILFSNVVGDNMYDVAQQLVIKPIINNVVSVDTSEWLTLFKTYPTVKAELKWDVNTQRVCKMAFQVFPSQESGQEGEIGKFGA